MNSSASRVTGSAPGREHDAGRAQPRTIHRKVSAFRTFNRYARRMSFTDKDPSNGVTLPKLEKRVREVVPERNINALLDSSIFPTLGPASATD